MFVSRLDILGSKVGYSSAEIRGTKFEIVSSGMQFVVSKNAINYMNSFVTNYRYG